MTGPPALPPSPLWRPLLEWALREDLGSGDATSALVIPARRTGEAVIEARAPLRLAGLALAEAVFEAVDGGVTFAAARRDGEDVAAGEPLATVYGPVRSLLAAERTALNFLGRLCGIATQTRRFVEAVQGTGAVVVDTRKTTPGWRVLEKYAVACGGGTNHRMGLFDGILLKDNHVAAAGGVAAAVKTALAAAPAHLVVQVEVESLEDAVAAADAGARFLLLDNRTPGELRAIAERLRGRAVLEASGGITLANAREVAETGVHRLSVGALTHSAPNADVALELTPGSVA